MQLRGHLPLSQRGRPPRAGRLVSGSALAPCPGISRTATLTASTFRLAGRDVAAVLRPGAAEHALGSRALCRPGCRRCPAGRDSRHLPRPGWRTVARLYGPAIGEVHVVRPAGSPSSTLSRVSASASSATSRSRQKATPPSRVMSGAESPASTIRAPSCTAADFDRLTRRCAGRYGDGATPPLPLTSTTGLTADCASRTFLRHQSGQVPGDLAVAIVRRSPVCPGPHRLRLLP